MCSWVFSGSFQVFFHIPVLCLPLHRSNVFSSNIKTKHGNNQLFSGSFQAVSFAIVVFVEAPRFWEMQCWHFAFSQSTSRFPPICLTFWTDRPWFGLGCEFFGFISEGLKDRYAQKMQPKKGEKNKLPPFFRSEEARYRTWQKKTASKCEVEATFSMETTNF